MYFNLNKDLIEKCNFLNQTDCFDYYKRVLIPIIILLINLLLWIQWISLIHKFNH